TAAGIDRGQTRGFALALALLLNGEQFTKLIHRLIESSQLGWRRGGKNGDPAEDTASEIIQALHDAIDRQHRHSLEEHKDEAAQQKADQADRRGDDQGMAVDFVFKIGNVPAGLKGT